MKKIKAWFWTIIVYCANPAVMGVFRFETGDFTSKVWKRANNPMGMKDYHVRQGFQTASSLTDDDVYGHYKNVLDGVRDFKAWWNYSYPDSPIPRNPEELVDMMHAKSYFEADIEHYKSQVAIWTDKSKRPMTVAITIMMSILSVIGVLIGKNWKSWLEKVR